MIAEVFACEKLTDGWKIWRCYSYDDQVDIPEHLGGLQVKELASYVFSRHMDPLEMSNLTERGILQYMTRESVVWDFGEEELPSELCGERLVSVNLPKSIRKIGRYAFYNCNKLGKLCFFSNLRDLGAGLFTGCHHVTDLHITIVKDTYSCFRTFLTEIPEELRVEYEEQGQSCRLIFPEYYEEGGEDTPAKNTKVIYHGSGLHFRNCFKDGIFQFGWYDDRFFRARSIDGDELALEFALNRLLYPMELSQNHRDNYETYVKEHYVEAIEWLMEYEKLEKVKDMLLDPTYKEWIDSSKLDALIAYAGAKKNPEAVSMLMDLKHRLFRPARKSFDL